jgi:hypothetical protein
MDGRTSGRTRLRVRESAAPHGRDPVEKLSISLPPALAARARAVAERDGTSLSAVIAVALHERLGRLDQEELDEALDADREESVRAAEALLPYAAALFAGSDW